MTISICHDKMKHKRFFRQVLSGRNIMLNPRCSGRGIVAVAMTEAHLHMRVKGDRSALGFHL